MLWSHDSRWFSLRLPPTAFSGTSVFELPAPNSDDMVTSCHAHAQSSLLCQALEAHCAGTMCLDLAHYVAL